LLTSIVITTTIIIIIIIIIIIRINVSVYAPLESSERKRVSQRKSEFRFALSPLVTLPITRLKEHGCCFILLLLLLLYVNLFHKLFVYNLQRSPKGSS
jgi:hypothetical protein